LVKDIWVLFSPRSIQKAREQMVENIKRVKKETMSWAHNKRILDEWELVSNEVALSGIYA